MTSIWILDAYIRDNDLLSRKSRTPHKAVRKMLVNFWPTFPISGNFFNLGQLFPF